MDPLRVHPGEDLELPPGAIADAPIGPGRFYELERRLWMDDWRAPAMPHGRARPRPARRDYRVDAVAVP
jgi:hypothetical protein